MEYVLGFAISGDAVLVRSHDLFPPRNGIGGKIESGETPGGAMQREWSEETGVAPLDRWVKVAILMFPTCDVHVFCSEVKMGVLQAACLLDEECSIWRPGGEVFPNVPHLVELCKRRLDYEKDI